MPHAQADCVVVGGGPAGAAAALTLRRHAPDRHVLLCEAGRHDRAKPGEILPAVAQGLLAQLGVRATFDAAGFVAGRAVASAWTSDDLDERHSIFSAQGPGWHLDRARFDRLMLDAAAAAGAEIRRGCTVRTVAHAGAGWRVETENGPVIAGALVWATGRRWALGRNLGAQVQVHGELAAHARFFERAPGDCRMVIEARPEGWWYSADLPDGRRVIACLTDPDIARDLDLRDAGWVRHLAHTRHIAPALPVSARETERLVRAAGTATLDIGTGENWVAAGDTLFAADPLSARGITHALRSGILAAYAASDMLDGRGDLARTRHAMITARGFAGYAPALAEHYAAAAARWDTPFWQRRTRPQPRSLAS